MRDYRWNTIALLLLRISQLMLGIVVLGGSAYFLSKHHSWVTPYTLAVSAFTLVWVAILLSLFFANKLLPVVVIIFDVVLVVCYIVAIATVADHNPDAVSDSCSLTTPSGRRIDQFVNRDCITLNAGFPVLVIQMLTFLGAIIWDGIVLYQNRNGRPSDVQAAAQNAMHGSGGGDGQMAGIWGAYGIPGLIMNPESGDRGAGGNHGERASLSQYQPTNSPIYPAEIASPAAPFDLHLQSHFPPATPQQGVMMQHHECQNHHQHQNHHQQQHIPQTHQDQPQRQQHQQNRGPSPQELDGMH
ncbi:hypothetical protein HOY80DRAFT_883243 [Tuber brumale]|nr:hypothetical protein HOY80DRAFT_883243 [Tuber brumale]